MPFDIKTAVPVIEKEGKSFGKTKFDISTATPYSVEEEKTFEENSKNQASLVAYTPTWRDKVSGILETVGLRPDRIERIGKAQAQVDEAKEMAGKEEISFDEALLTIFSRERADPVEALKVFGDVIARTPKA
ncbi:hypothetical protein KAT51_07270, partial [bacterium]|nr:hypothetical protein [bacterium]